MGRLGIGEWDVEQAIEQLVVRGKNPTIDAIREVLGRGSKTTISKHLHTIRSELKNESPLLRMPERLVEVVQHVWTEINRMTDERIQKIETHSLEKQTHDQTRIDALSSEKNHYFTLLNEEIQNRTAVEEELKKTMKALSDITASYERLEHTLTVQERVLEEGKAENKRLHELAKHMQDNLEHYQDAMQKQRTEHLLQTEKWQQTWRAEVASLEEKNTEAIHTLQIQNQSLLETKTELQYALQQKETWMRKAEHSDQLLTQEKNTTLLLEEREKQTQILLREQKEMGLDAQKKGAHLEKEYLLTLHQLKECKEKIQFMEDQLNRVNDANRFLTQEKHELQGQLNHFEKMYSHFMKLSKEHV